MFSKFRVWSETTKEYLSQNFFVASNGDLYKFEYGKMLNVTCPALIVENMVGFARDINNQLLFEGDLVKFKDDNRIFKVYYHPELCAWFCKEEDGYSCTFANCKIPFEIIGNIHEGKNGLSKSNVIGND